MHLRLIPGFFNILGGMWVTFKNIVRPKVTIRYPYERRPVSARYRGLFYIQWNGDKERLNCIGCGQCQQACPTGVITMHKIGKGPDAGVDEFNMDLGRCMFCGLCLEACNFDALKMGDEYEFAFYRKDGCVLHLKDLCKAGEEKLNVSVEKISEAAEAAEKLAAEKAAAVKAAMEAKAKADAAKADAEPKEGGE